MGEHGCPLCPLGGWDPSRAAACCRAALTEIPLLINQADVLVCARGGGGLLRERMALVSSLWAAGIRAELLPAAAPSSTAQYEHARAAGIGWMVTLQAATLSSSDTVVVRLCWLLTDKFSHFNLVVRCSGDVILLFAAPWLRD